MQTTIQQTEGAVDVGSARLFRGLRVVSRVEKPERGSEQWQQLTWAIGAWRRAAISDGQNMHICENAARELEIERDHGVIVHLNTRTG